MLETTLTVLLAVYAAYSLAKFLFFFVLSYDKRRVALDKAYRGRTSATKTQDNFFLLFSVLLCVLLFVTDAHIQSFLTGLLVGATLIQIYFHRFGEPLDEDKSPPPPVSPIKMMSYAIQANPEKPWKELLVFAALLVFCLVRLTIWPN